MAIIKGTNTANVSVNSGTAQPSNTVNFEAAKDVAINITKQVDNSKVYYNNDTISFTITLKSVDTTITGAINKITLTDQFPSIVSYTTSNVNIVGTHGAVTIDTSTNTLTIENLVLNGGTDTIVITVTGTITIV